jgi:hypothetical protein
MNAYAKSINEINLMSVFLQESITSFAWMTFQKQVFYILINRKAVEYNNNRSNNILEIHNVCDAKTKFEPKNEFLYVMSMVCRSSNEIIFSFSDTNTLKLSVSKIFVELKSISREW